MMVSWKIEVIYAALVTCLQLQGFAVFKVM